MSSNDNIKKEEEEIYYVIDYKNKLEPINNIIRIKPENKETKENKQRTFSFQIGSFSEEELTGNQTAFSTSNNSGRIIYMDSNLQKLVELFTEKLFPKCDLNGFKICKNISTKYLKRNGNKIDKDRLEQSVNYIYSNKQNIIYNGKINLEIFYRFGYILIASYHLFSNFNINDRKELKNNIKKTHDEHQDVYLDFCNHYQSKKQDLNKKNKTKFWEKNRKKYFLPGIFVFLINIFSSIEIIEINFEEYNKIFTNEDLDFFTMFVFNLELIFHKLNYIKINLNNKIFQQKIYIKDSEEYMTILKTYNNSIKKRCLKINNIYDIKWDFKADFLLNKYKEKNKIKKNTKIDENINKKPILKSKTSIDVNISDLKNQFTKSFKDNDNADDSLDSQIENEQEEFNINNKTNPDLNSKENNNKENPLNFIKIILLLINGLNKIKNLNKIDLILNNSYSEEINNFFKKEIFEPENDDKLNSLFFSKMKDFHILELILTKLVKLKTINCEFNSLDISTFNQILKALYINQNITTLNLSFFTSDITYLQQSLYKKYNPSFSDTELDYRGDVENSILEKILPLYTQNLRSFFDILKLKSFYNFGVNMDFPDILENNNKYMLLITKFILNLIIYMYSKDNFSDSIEKLLIICPKLKLNSDYYPFVDKILSRINKDNAKNIKELSFQAQLYKIVNIKNIISESLVNLNIGNCDIITFKSLVLYLTSYKFSKNSNLEKINLGLVKTMRVLNRELYNLLYKIYNIKIAHLLELNIYSNIIINTKDVYFYFLNIFNNNWIPKSIFILNEDSEEIINMKECIEKKMNIKCFIPFFGENELLSQAEKKIALNRRKPDEVKNDEIYWILKYIFIIKYSCNEIMVNNIESLSKRLTNLILSYIHFTKNMNIQHHVTYSN